VVGATPGTLPPVKVRDAAPLHALPPASPGDLFFDFEGDPLYTEHDPTVWGLDYLFGMVDADSAFTPYWAHSFAEERDALIAFLDDVETRRRAHPDLHVYHYAAYERTHLRSLSARHGVGEDIVDEWLRTGVLVDLYPVVTRALRLGTPNYSIKSLEKIYWPDARAGADLARGDDSVAMYVDARSARENGKGAEAEALLATIADYNRVDCVSTLRLAAWLRGLAAQHPAPAPTLTGDDAADDDAKDDPGPRLDDSPLRTALLELAANADGSPATEPDRTAEQRAYAYAAAAIDYHRREHKTFWWEHFDRLVAPLDDWADVRDVFVVDPDAPHEQTPWGKSGKQRSLRRTLTLHGTWAPGSRPTVSGRSGPFAVYNQPAPMPSNNRDRLARSTRAVALDRIGEGFVVVTETLADGVDAYTDLPIALTPASPPDPGQQKPAIEEWGARLVDAAATSSPPEWPAEPVGDLLRRVQPRTRSGAALAQVADDANGEPDRVSAVVASLLDLDRSYLAVQGPPGTGKTYLGSHVIARLVSTHGWKVGVVAQSHTTVEHVLEKVVETGLDSRLVGKAPKSSADPADYATARYTVLGKADDVATFAADRPEGYVIGGTAWDFANPKRVGRRALDLLVIDEAGQFSLAATIAASMAAKNLLLLGDPQQLPQVSQGTHPEPIDGSALGYLSAGHDVLPAELGYFLAETRRLHPALAEPVSRLSYEGRLHAHPSSSLRRLDGVEPGLHPVPVHHEGNATESVEEADEVVAIIRRLIGSAWTPGPDAAPRPLNRRRRHRRHALQRSAADVFANGSTLRASRRRASARSTSFRGRRLRSPSSRLRPRARATPRAAWSFCSTATASTSPSRAPSGPPTWCTRPGCSTRCRTRPWVWPKLTRLYPPHRNNSPTHDESRLHRPTAHRRPQRLDAGSSKTDAADSISVGASSDVLHRYRGDVRGKSQKEFAPAERARVNPDAESPARRRRRDAAQPKSRRDSSALRGPTSRTDRSEASGPTRFSARSKVVTSPR